MEFNLTVKARYRYMKDNPIEPFSYREYNTLGFVRGSDGRCGLSVSCRNPNEFYVNGEKITSTRTKEFML